MQYETRPDEPVSVAVVRAVSAFEGRPRTSLPPLHDVIDPDALDALFRSSDGVDRRGRVSFPFSDSVVTIDERDRVAVQSREPSPRERPCR